jgi:hypothetical protein
MYNKSPDIKLDPIHVDNPIWLSAAARIFHFSFYLLFGNTIEGSITPNNMREEIVCYIVRSYQIQDRYPRVVSIIPCFILSSVSLYTCIIHLLFVFVCFPTSHSTRFSLSMGV